MKKLFQLLVCLPMLIQLGCSEDPTPTPTFFTADMGASPMMPNPMPVDGCGTGPACQAGDICRDGMCVPDVRTCEPACAVGEVCDRATLTCRTEEDGKCELDSECETGFCIGERCQDVDCVRDENCNAGEYCEENQCLPAAVECADGDGDGYGIGPDCLGLDCDDTRADVNPGVRENGQLLCDDEIDHDCDGTPALCGDVDADNDGITVRAGDCDDNDPEVNPERAETPYNNKDDDCDETTSDSDVDGDGFAGGLNGAGDDCDDRDITRYPGAPEIAGDGIDQDCDGEDRIATEEDLDMDGFSEQDGDCDDNDATVNPGATEVEYNGKDDDCDETTLDNDLDMDGVPFPEDCDDTKRAVNPNIEEIYYNGTDDDCDENTVDDDADGDGYPFGENGTDCNDQAASVNPGAMEIPYNGEDDDCNVATVDDDLDGDGFPIETDCNDEDANVNPEIIEDANTNCGDDIDNDCIGGDIACGIEVTDTDMDGVPDEQDCAPMNPEVPGPREIVNNGIDDDCNPETVDECPDDVFDQARSNGNPVTASAVADGNTRSAQYGALKLCASDRDWYTIDVAQGSGLEVDLFFSDEEGDLDARLYKVTDDGLQFVDNGFTVTDDETLYLRRADADATYAIEVFSFNPSASVEYSMGVNVFDDCVDDEDVLFGYEHNDTAAAAISLPNIRDILQICDYDDDYFTFTVEQTETVRLDLIFTDREGDLDMTLEGEALENSLRSWSFNDNEVIEAELEPGTYTVRIFGYGDDQNTYRLFKTNGIVSTTTVELSGDGREIPDYADRMAGVLDVDITVDAPIGSIIRMLKIKSMDLNHEYLTDLRLTALWDGVPIVVLWDREGATNGGDGGFDDDFTDILGGRDIVFSNREYPEFTGLPANGLFTLRIEDLAATDTGSIDKLELEVEYFAP